MEDAIILLTDTNDPKENIINIKVFTLSGDLALDISGCGAPSCQNSLGSLSPDDYEVRVYTDEQDTFSKVVTVGHPD